LNEEFQLWRSIADSHCANAKSRILSFKVVTHLSS
jgi:hypothetical protein